MPAGALQLIIGGTGDLFERLDEADVVTFTTHKVLRGPRGGMILCKEEHAAKIDKARGRLVAVILRLAAFAREYRDLPCLGFTHLQPAQPYAD